MVAWICVLIAGSSCSSQSDLEVTVNAQNTRIAALEQISVATATLPAVGEETAQPNKTDTPRSLPTESPPPSSTPGSTPTAEPLPSDTPLMNAPTPTVMASDTPVVDTSGVNAGIWKAYVIDVWKTNEAGSPIKKEPYDIGWTYAAVEVVVENVSGNAAWLPASRIMLGNLIDSGGYERTLTFESGIYTQGSIHPMLIPPSFRVSTLGFAQIPEIYDPVLAKVRFLTGPYGTPEGDEITLDLESPVAGLDMPFETLSPAVPLAHEGHTFDWPNDRKVVVEKLEIVPYGDSVQVFVNLEAENVGGGNLRPYHSNGYSGIFFWAIDHHGHFTLETAISGEDRGNLEQIIAPGQKASGTIAMKQIFHPVEEIDAIWVIIGVENSSGNLQWAVFEVKPTP